MYFRQSLAMCPVVPQRGKACCQDGADAPVELASIFPELLFFCLELEENLPDLLSDLELYFCLDLLLKALEVWVLQETSPFHSQFCVSIAWMIFWSPARVVGLFWWTMSSLMHLASTL